MTFPPSFPPPARPDLGARLLAAVAERDQPMAERLVQQWVHRRGLAALEALMQGPLLASQGGEATAWLRQRAGLTAFADLEPPVAPTVAAPEPVAVVELAAALEPEADVEPEAVAKPEEPRVWPQLRVVPGGAPAPAPRSLDLLRAWLPDADADGDGPAEGDGRDDVESLPLAS